MKHFSITPLSTPSFELKSAKNQPRVPAGSSRGGEFTSTPGGISGGVAVGTTDLEVKEVSIPAGQKGDMSHFTMKAKSSDGYTLEVYNKNLDSGTVRGWVEVKKDGYKKPVLETPLQTIAHFNVQTNRFDVGELRPLTASQNQAGKTKLQEMIVQRGGGAGFISSGESWQSKRNLTPNDILKHPTIKQYGFSPKKK